MRIAIRVRDKREVQIRDIGTRADSPVLSKNPLQNKGV